MVTIMDPLSDMLIQIKNAGNAGRESVSIPYSKFVFAVANVLLREGYVASVSRKGRGIKKTIEVSLVYEDSRPKIRGLKRMSKLSRRVYVGIRDIRPVRQGYGNLILSTPRGILTGKEAKKEKVGGEALFTIW